LVKHSIELLDLVLVRQCLKKLVSLLVDQGAVHGSLRCIRSMGCLPTSTHEDGLLLERSGVRLLSHLKALTQGFDETALAIGLAD